jgi:hypothetical protein
MLVGRASADVIDLPVAKALRFFQQCPCGRGGNGTGLDADIAGPILKEVSDRLRFSVTWASISHAGPRRRVALRRRDAAHPARHADRLAARGVLYILDEPSIGLHQRDNERLLGTLRALRDLGNTVHRRRARRGHHPQRRPHHRPRAARGPLRRRGGGGGHARGRRQPIPPRSPRATCAASCR